MAKATAPVGLRPFLYSRVVAIGLLLLAIAITGVMMALVAHWQRAENGEWSRLLEKRQVLQLNKQRLGIDLSIWSQPVRIEQFARQSLGLDDIKEQKLIVVDVIDVDGNRAGTN